jgi:hypothetical protein
MSNRLVLPKVKSVPLMHVIPEQAAGVAREFGVAKPKRNLRDKFLDVQKRISAEIKKA